MTNIEKILKNRIRMKKNLCVPWYLMSSYAYYVEDNPIISDAVFDWLAKFTLKKFDKIEHRHKHLITEDELRAGTLLLSQEDYPSIVIGGLNSVRKTLG